VSSNELHILPANTTNDDNKNVTPFHVNVSAAGISIGFRSWMEQLVSSLFEYRDREMFLIARLGRRYSKKLPEAASYALLPASSFPHASRVKLGDFMTLHRQFRTRFADRTRSLLRLLPREWPAVREGRPHI
jgi:hypothetical protein